MSQVDHQDEYYVTGIALSQFVLGGERLGLPTRELLRSCGLDECVHLQPMARVPVQSYERFLLELILTSGDEMIGFHIGQQVMPSVYGVISLLGMGCSTLRESIEITARYQSLISGNVGELTLSSQGDGMQVTLRAVHQNPVLRRHIFECVLVLLGRLYRFISGYPGLSPRRIWLEYAPVSDEAAAMIRKEANCPVEFAAGSSGLELGPEALAVTLNAYGDDTMRMAEALAQRQLEEQQQFGSALSQIRIQVHDLMLTGVPRRELVADRLKISVRTLDRRLADIGLTWQSLLDSMRLQLAREYLANPTVTVKEVADRLGFADLRAFQRRFKVWTGMTPSEYRQK
ncbi:MAG: AraC family transcriptional regulator [Alcanivoracaceae bacterium]|jgi:AraC-like DNA-binding protein|nr:AraC family transcriptional regulator [Alcanivoracaceae bacterium]